jgi:phage-related protein
VYEVVFYEDAHGYNPVGEFIMGLDQKAATDKNSRIQLKQIIFSLDLLERIGTRASSKHVKHVRDDIWELRPGNNRILFFSWKRNILVMLHSFRKTTDKTPICEIEKAQRKLDDWARRHGN